MVTHQPYDDRTDVFALGCIIYELFSRELRSASLFVHSSNPNLLSDFALKVCAHLNLMGTPRGSFQHNAIKQVFCLTANDLPKHLYL
jgi:serine/threonine protein kinase